MTYDAVRVRRDPLPHLRERFPVGLQQVIEGVRPKGPAHVEIHPHHFSTEHCNNNCDGCTGRHYRSLPTSKFAGIRPERLLETIDSFKGTPVTEVVFSGNCTEPLLYPWVVPAMDHIRRAGLKFSLYSNFFYADQPGFVDALTSPQALDDYVRISIDASTPEGYEKTHNPTTPHSFKKVRANIEALLDAKRTRGSKLFVHLTYLMSNHNSSDDELKQAVEYAASHPGINCMRFTTYQKPLGRDMLDSSYIPPAELQRVVATLDRLKLQYDRQGEFSVMPMFDEMNRQQKEKPFAHCYVQDVFGVIGFDGGVYPCTAMAYPDCPPHLRFGDINHEDFWTIWNRRKADFPLDRCYDCTRAEFNINAAIQNERNK